MTTRTRTLFSQPWQRTTRTGWLTLAGVLAVQLLLVLVVVLPQLSPRVAGTEVTLRVTTLDPMEPFRGAYVQLGYPDLPQPEQERNIRAEPGTAYIPLTQDGQVWVGGPIQRTAPDGLFLKCHDDGWRLACGIESWFDSQDRAQALEQELSADGAIATVRVDRWGNAALVAVK